MNPSGLKSSAAIALCIAATLVIVVGLAATGLLGMNRFEAATDEISEDRVPRLVLISRWEISLLQSARHTRNVLLLDDPKAVQDELTMIAAERQRRIGYMLRLSSMESSAAGRAKLDQVLKAREVYVAPEDEFIALAQAGSLAAAKRKLLESTRPTQLAYVAALDSYLDFQMAQIADAKTDVFATYGVSCERIYLLATAAITVLFLFALWLRAILTQRVTERRETEQRLVASERLESMGRLAAGVAHEINTPVQYVNDSLYFVREGVDELLGLMKSPRGAQAPTAPDTNLTELQQQLPEALHRADEGLSRIAAIVRSMKEYAHPDDGPMTPADINHGILTTLTIGTHEYKYVADVETHLGPLPPVMCHSGLVNQVILNLVINAAHAIGDVMKSTHRRGLIVIRTFVEGDQAVISVGDNGGGISEAIRDRIFEPFFTTKEVGRGTGQGLTIARNVVVRLHGGTVTFQTQPGHGTTFFVRLPIAGKGAQVQAAAA
jgi:signal transduction histidine kinase